MYYLERKEPNAAPDKRWIPIFFCPERWLLKYILKFMDKERYRITSRSGVRKK